MRRTDPAAAPLRAWALALCLCGAMGLATAATAAPVFDLDTLAVLLAQRKSAETRFTEERTVSGFDSPLRASGTLSFRAPDHFARHTLEPRAESMIVDGNTVSIRRGGRTRQLAVDAVPELTALIEAVRGTLSGNTVTLRRHFEVRVAGNAAQWTMTLVPRDERLAAQVRELQVVGQRGDLRTLELSLAGGDRSLMVLEPSSAAATGSSSATPPTVAAPAAARPASR